MSSGLLTIIIVLGLLIFFWKIFPTSMFITAQFAGTPISFAELLGMRIRKVDVDKVALAYIKLRKANVDIKLTDLEVAFLLNHDLENITRGLIISKQKNIPLTLEQAKEADKKGINMMEELKRVTDT